MHLHKDIHSYIYGIHICMEGTFYMCMYIHIYIYRCAHNHVHIIISIYLTYNKIITPALVISFPFPSFPISFLLTPDSLPHPHHTFFSFFPAFSYFPFTFFLHSSSLPTFSLIIFDFFLLLPFLLPPLISCPYFHRMETNFLYLPIIKMYTHDWGTWDYICYSPNNNIYTLTVCLYLWWIS